MEKWWINKRVTVQCVKSINENICFHSSEVRTLSWRWQLHTWFQPDGAWINRNFTRDLSKSLKGKNPANVLNIPPLRAWAHPSGCHLCRPPRTPHCAHLTSNISRDLDSSGPLVLLPIAVGCCCPQLAVEWDGQWTVDNPVPALPSDKPNNYQ